MSEPTGQTQPEGDGPDSEESVVATERVDSDAGHWTRDRMRSAEPAERRLDPTSGGGAGEQFGDAEQFED